MDHRAAGVRVPNLEDKLLIARGAGQYAAMCAQCHLAPGMQPNELSKGLYPAPPLLSERKQDPRISYLAIENDIKIGDARVGWPPRRRAGVDARRVRGQAAGNDSAAV